MEAVREVLNILLNFILTISFWDILDIAIVAYLIYRLITVVRKTSSGSVIRGIIVVLAVMWLSSLLNLNVINYLLGQTMKLGLLVLIILFQPELRRFLEQMGSKDLRYLFSKKVSIGVMEASIASTVAACIDMSKKRTGALIVFERDISLDEVIKTGTRLDSVLSVELLTSVFFPRSPLHDGAVIVRHGRVTAAACVLPLSTNTNISRNLGTRHRSGIGMSEMSDAVVVIVSEETGSISVAVNGMLKRHLAQDTFEKLLQNELLPADAPEIGRRRLRDRLKGKK
jgi:diadenylate cyclase